MIARNAKGDGAMAAAPAMLSLKLGLIGDNIGQSKAPLLHITAGKLTGIEATYDRLVPSEIGRSFDEIFAMCAPCGYRGVNITYPYKEAAAPKVRIDDPTVRAIGAVNTVVFSNSGVDGFNTDYSGFIAAYRAARGNRLPGRVCIVGAGGVGKAVAFALLKLGVESFLIIDLNVAKANALATNLHAFSPAIAIDVSQTTNGVAGRANGLINCTPVGMVEYPGTSLPREAMIGAQWAFDAVYTPLVTQFLSDAYAVGLETISGFELFFHQGVDAWKIFSGQPVDAARLRGSLLELIAGQ